MKLAVTEAELQKLLGESEFFKVYQYKLYSFGEGECTLEVPYQKLWERPGGVTCGPVFMAVADVTMWFAIMTRLGIAKAEMAVTVEMKTNFLSGAKQDNILCKAKVLKLGRRLIYGVAECMNPEGKLFTHHTLTYIS